MAGLSVRSDYIARRDAGDFDNLCAEHGLDARVVMGWWFQYQNNMLSWSDVVELAKARSKTK